MHLCTSKSFSIDMFLMVSFPMHRTALLATSGGLDRAHLTACSSRELYRGTYQGRKHGLTDRQTDRQMEGHIGGQIDKLKCTVSHRWTRLTWPDPFLPVLRKHLHNTGRKGSGPVRLQMYSNIVVWPATPNFSCHHLLSQKLGLAGQTRNTGALDTHSSSPPHKQTQKE